MERLLGKAGILLICTVALCMNGEVFAPVTALLAAVTASSAVQLLRGKTAVVIMLLWSLSCAFFPPMLLTMPVLVCDAVREKKLWVLLPALAAMPHIGSFTGTQLLLAAATVFAALITELRLSKLENTVDLLTSMRDEGTEQNIRLTEQNARLTEAQDNAVRLATMQERNRIAREIHDNVGHMLTRSLLQAGALNIVNKDEKLKEPLESLRSTLDQAMTSIRESVHDLHDDSIDLRKVIEDSIATVGERFNVELDYSCGNDTPGNIKLCIAGVVKEGLSNAVKHSDGDRIKLILREHPGFWQLVMEDNGHPKGISSGGIGLRNMEDRARSAGGTISFTPSDKGFRIFMTIPRDKKEV